MDSRVPTVRAERLSARSVRWVVEYADGRRYEMAGAPRATTKLEHFAYTVGVELDELIAVAQGQLPRVADDEQPEPPPASTDPSDYPEDLELPDFATTERVNLDEPEPRKVRELPAAPGETVGASFTFPTFPTGISLDAESRGYDDGGELEQDPHQPHSFWTETGLEGRCGICGGPASSDLHRLEQDLEDLSGANDKAPRERAPRFTPTGDAVLDYTLTAAGVKIPHSKPTDAPTDWASVMGSRVLSGNGNGANGDAHAGEESAEPERPFRLRIRGRLKTAGSAEQIEQPAPLIAFDAALAAERLPKEAMIEWPRSELDRLACLDVDFHRVDPPDAAEADAILSRVSPWPARAWRSHGGGLHLIFSALAGFTAEELAAAAGLSLLEQFEPGCRPEVEVLSRTSHPRAKREGKRAGDVLRQEPSVDRMMRGWRQRELVGLDDDDVTEWLAANGFQIGGRYPHERCPFDPRSNSKGGDPVVVSEDGVHCFVCAAHGHTSGGHASFGRLVGSYRNSRVLDAAQGFVYYEQARHLLVEEYPHVPPALFEPAWACFLKLVHGPADPRVPKAMTRFYVVRGDGNIWLDSETLRPISPKVDPKVTQLMPSACFVGADEKTGLPAVKVSARLHDLHRTNQAIPGFPVVVPVRGVKLWGQHQRYPGREVRSVVPSSRPDEIPPRYIPPSRRMSVRDAFAALEQSYPGVDLEYLELLIAARGWAESGAGPVPMVMVTGPTGAAKTATVMLAATICGDSCASVKEQDRAKFSESLGERCARCGFVLLDEFAKTVGARRVRMLFDLLLDVGREYTYRRLYVGPVTASLNSVLVITNNVFPQDVKQNAQLGRRLVFVELQRRAPALWENTCGTGDVRFWRTIPENAEIADTILSYIVDKHFIPGGTVDGWLGSARACGFDLLETTRTSSAGVSIDDTVRELFALVCAEAPPAPDRWRGRGWRLLKLDGATDLEKCWRVLCDDPSTMDGFSTSMRVAELDLANVLGASEPVRLDISRHGRALGIRFITGSVRGKGTGCVNEEIETTVDPTAPRAAASEYDDTAEAPDFDSEDY